MAKWTEDHMPDQSGRRFVVTGGNTGLGYETARALAQRGGDVTIACRSESRATAAVEKLRALQPKGSVGWAPLDLADLNSVAAYPFAPADVLINNAGVMVPPPGMTPSGFETQWGVNVVGHFAFTMRMLPHLAPGGRVVTLSSVAHRAGRIQFNNFRGERRYVAAREYCQSKLGDLMMALELDRRLTSSGSSVRSVASHPGVSRTELTRSHGWMDWGVNFVSQSAAKGALPTLYAATMDVPGGSYWGPRGFREYWGYPAEARMRSKAQDREVAAKLWDHLEKATGLGLPDAVVPAYA